MDDILLTTKTKRTPGPDTRFHCPRCGDVPARTYLLEEKMGVLFIPLITQRETYVACRACGAALLTRLPLEELGEYSADGLTPHLFPRVSIIVQFLAVASVVLFCAPFVGLVLGAIGLLTSYRTGGWPKRLSLIGIGLSSVVHVIFVILLLSR